jgi:hypothetical protein
LLLQLAAELGMRERQVDYWLKRRRLYGVDEILSFTNTYLKLLLKALEYLEFYANFLT